MSSGRADFYAEFSRAFTARQPLSAAAIAYGNGVEKQAI
jgi:hypothetical protein